jgi:hypothetical protein
MPSNGKETFTGTVEAGSLGNSGGRILADDYIGEGKFVWNGEVVVKADSDALDAARQEESGETV